MQALAKRTSAKETKLEGSVTGLNDLLTRVIKFSNDESSQSTSLDALLMQTLER